MALPFRQRIFLILVALTAVPTALAVVGWALAVRTVGPSAGTRAGWEEVAAAARDMADRIDTTRLGPRERAAGGRRLEQGVNGRAPPRTPLPLEIPNPAFSLKK